MPPRIETHTETAPAAPSPSAAIVKAARPERTVVDSLGRTIVFKGLSVLDSAKLFRAAGADAAGNAEYMGLARVAATVVSIDGQQRPPAINLLQLDSRIGWLGDEGYEALFELLSKEQREADALAEENSDTVDEEFKRSVKN